MAGLAAGGGGAPLGGKPLSLLRRSMVAGGRSMGKGVSNGLTTVSVGGGSGLMVAVEVCGSQRRPGGKIQWPWLVDHGGRDKTGWS
jgi:hypothetical protein